MEKNTIELDSAARREARRRKILENSKNRLAKISGKEGTNQQDEEGNIII